MSTHRLFRGFLLAFAFCSACHPSKITIPEEAHHDSQKESVAKEKPKPVLPPDLKEDQLVVSKVRGYSFEKLVEAEIHDRNDFRELYDKEVSEAKTRIERDGIFLSILGLVDSADAFRAEIINAGAEESGGVYLPKEKQLWLSKLVDNSELAHQVLLHELVHALQDEHFDLKKLNLWEETGHEEQADVAHALFEGDAQLYGYLAYRCIAGDCDFDSWPEELIEAEQRIRETLASEKNLVRASMIAPYYDGLRYLRLSHQKLGRQGIDAALSKPPLHSISLLLPELDTSNLEEVVCSAELGSVGAASLRLLLSQIVDFDTAETLASSWRGDNFKLHQGQDQNSIIWQITSTKESSSALHKALSALVKQNKVSGELALHGETLILTARSKSTLAKPSQP